jgi:hypothetical protein
MSDLLMAKAIADIRSQAFDTLRIRGWRALEHSLIWQASAVDRVFISHRELKASTTRQPAAPLRTSRPPLHASLAAQAIRR